MDRRTFVIGGVATAGFVLLGGVATAFAGPGDLLRPTGGQDEAAFVARCVKCDRCRSACPQQCIQTASLEDGLLAARTPKMNFHRGACDFCGKCVEVCPTRALVPFDPEVDKIGVAVVDENRCLAVDGSCQVCSDVCPYGAISFAAGGMPVVDAALCNGCGVCEYRCPSSVLRAYSATGKRGINIEKCEAGR